MSDENYSILEWELLSSEEFYIAYFRGRKKLEIVLLSFFQ